MVVECASCASVSMLAPGEGAGTALSDEKSNVAAVSACRVDLAVAFRIAAMNNLHEGIDNHFSLRLPNGCFLLNSYGVHWSEIRPQDILEVDDDGIIRSGTGRWDAAAFTIHRAVHLARPQARAVFHTHMPYATAVANTVDGLDTRLTQTAMYFHGRVATLAFDGLATVAAEGERIRSAMGDEAAVVLMRNHGVLVIGESVADAWHKLYMLERACQAQVFTLSQGVAAVRVSEAVAANTARQWHEVEKETAELLFEAARRQVARADLTVATWSADITSTSVRTSW